MKVNTKRQTLFKYFFASFAFCFLSYLAYWFFYYSNYISTTNAYVGADVAEVTSLVEGQIKHVYVNDTKRINVGDLLVEIDDSDAILALKQSEARLLKMHAGLKVAQLNYQRRKRLVRTNIISQEELGNAENNLSAAQAMLDEAAAANDLAKITCQRTKIYAPINGVIAKRQVQLGQKVMPGSKLLSVVPLSNIYVNANFKENELKFIKPNQSVVLTSDKYGSKIKFNGIVEGFAGGTGSVFAIIPSQNASGNWVKVVQRVPVRIRLADDELLEWPLEIGLSMHVKINLSEKK